MNISDVFIRSYSWIKSMFELETIRIFIEAVEYHSKFNYRWSVDLTSIRRYILMNVSFITDIVWITGKNMEKLIFDTM